MSYSELKDSSSAVLGNVVEFQAPQLCSQLPGKAEFLSSGVCPCEHLEAVSCLVGHSGLENVVLELNKQNKTNQNKTKSNSKQQQQKNPNKTPKRTYSQILVSC